MPDGKNADSHLDASPASPRHSVSASSERLSPSAITIGLVSLFADISTEMIYPLLPIYLTQVLAAPKSAVGLIEGIAVGTASIVTSFSGWISDRLHRRREVAFSGYALTVLSRPLIALASAWPLVLVARFADRFGKGIRSAPKDALIADTSSEAGRGRAYGFERAMDNAGAVLGPLTGLALLAWLGAERMTTIFFISTIPAAVAAILILTLREKRDERSASAQSIKFSLAGVTREYRCLLAVTAVFGLANSANAFLILRAENLGLATEWTIIAYALYNAVAALGSMPAGTASDRFGRRNLLIIGYGIYAISYAGFGLATEAWMAWPLFVLYGMFPAMTDGVAKAMAVDTAGSAGRATAIGMYSMVAGITQIAASYVGGLLWDRIDARATFYFGAALAAISVVLLFVLLPSKRRA
ncbi:MAG TPA: MFS transporter [Blastocatellia bacterium]|jgi:MFS family permease